jgi:hypothetical protein
MRGRADDVHRLRFALDHEELHTKGRALLVCKRKLVSSAWRCGSIRISASATL